MSVAKVKISEKKIDVSIPCEKFCVVCESRIFFSLFFYIIVVDFTEDQGLLVVYTPLLSIEIRDINLSSYKTSCWDRGPCCLCFHINCGMHFLFINLLNNSSTFFISEYHKVAGRGKGMPK